MKALIALPKFAAQHVSKLRCRHCGYPLLPSNALAAGVRHPTGFASAFVFAMTIHCDHCKKRTPCCVPQRPMDGTHWAAQVAAATPTPRAVPPERKLMPAKQGVSGDDGSVVDDSEQRPEYHAVPVVVLNYAPANCDHADGEPASTLSIAGTDGSIQPLVFSIQDTRKLVTRALITLATYDDPLAEKMLDKFFESDDEGNFCWPEEPPPAWA